MIKSDRGVYIHKGDKLIISENATCFDLYWSDIKMINVNYDKLESDSRYFLPLVVSCFLCNLLKMSYDKLFAAPYKTKKIYLSFLGYE